MSNKDNKIDKVIDEVLESERLKQGVGIIVKLLIFGALVIGAIMAFIVIEKGHF